MVNSDADAEPLNPSAATRYRAIVPRMNYLGQVRSEMQFAVKALGKEMSIPTQLSRTRMERLEAIEVPQRAPRAVLHFEYQKRPKALVT